MGLKLKIFIGYAILILLLGFIICLFRGERMKRDELKHEMKELGIMHDLTRKAYGHLLGLASQGEVAIIWNESDLKRYREKRESTCGVLKELRQFVHVAEQQERIDSVCILLEEKEILLVAAMNTFAALGSIGETLGEKVPAIVRQVRRGTGGSSPVTLVGNDTVTKESAKEKKGIWNFFRKKEQKSAYQKQREAERKSPVTDGTRNDDGNTAVYLLHALSREVTEKQQEQREKLSAQMDSLHQSSLALNRRLNGLICDFDKVAAERLEARYSAIGTEREESYNAAVMLALFVFLLAIILYVILHRDVNRRLSYHRELEISHRKNRELLQSRKDMMLAIAHDLRAPLTAIRGYAELMPGEADGKRKDEYAEGIRNSSDYMLGLVNTLIEFHQLDTDRIRPMSSIFRLETLFKEIADCHSPEAGKKNLRFVTSFSGLDAVVCGDNTHIRQIADNLLSNAIKFTGQGEIHFRAEYTGGELRFSVQDSGTGMTEEEKKRIFKPFGRLENARNVSGFGLGLAIAGRLASKMKGIITVKSRPGEGSTFMVLLPLPRADESARIDEEEPSVDYALDGLRVLVIDDDCIQLDITQEMLKRNRIRCDCCRNSRELFSRLREQEYELLLSDIQMPETEGYEILKLLRSSNIGMANTIPVIAVTARADDENEYLSHGFAGCLRKPFSMDELMDIVARVAGEREDKGVLPDFSLLLSCEDNRQEMLELFITESGKELDALTRAVERQEQSTAMTILHKNLPLWETVRLDFPLSRLRKLITEDTAEWTDRQYKEIREIIRAVEKLMAYVEKIRKESL